MSDYSAMNLHELANAIVTDFRGKGKPLPYAAEPYISAMLSLTDITDNYGADSATGIVAYALSNLSGWRGDVAKAVKAELRKRIA
jgi:hypothetical protein